MHEVVENVLLKHGPQRAHSSQIAQDRHGEHRHARQIAQRILPQAAPGADGIADVEQHHHAQPRDVADLDERNRRRGQPQQKRPCPGAARLSGIGVDHHREAQQHEKKVEFLAVQVLSADPQQHRYAGRHAEDVAPFPHQPARHQHQQRAVAQGEEHLQHIHARRSLHDPLWYRHHQEKQRSLVFRDLHIGRIPLDDAAAHAQEDAAVRPNGLIRRIRARKRRKRPHQHHGQAHGLSDNMGCRLCTHGSHLLCTFSQVDPR